MCLPSHLNSPSLNNDSTVLQDDIEAHSSMQSKPPEATYHRDTSPEQVTNTLQVESESCTITPVNSRHAGHKQRCCPKDPFGDSWTSWYLLMRITLSTCISGLYFGSFSLLYVEFTHYFQTTKAVVGWINSIHFFSIYIFSMCA